VGINQKPWPTRLLRWGLAAAACLAGALAAPAHAATAPAAGRAVIVTPLSLVNIGGLHFGNIIPGATPGTVTVNQNTGIRTATGGATLAGGPVSRAGFQGLTGGFGIVQVTIPAAPVTLNRAGGGSMNANLVLSNLPGFVFINGPTNKVSIIGSNTLFSFAVGGTLNVGANQLQGTYTATFNVTANYF
jgi:hypothetical protein